MSQKTVIETHPNSYDHLCVAKLKCARFEHSLRSPNEHVQRKQKDTSFIAYYLLISRKQKDAKTIPTNFVEKALHILRLDAHVF